MRVDRVKLTEALAYRKILNNTPFRELDWSEYPEFKNMSEKEIRDFILTGLNNTDFVNCILEE